MLTREKLSAVRGAYRLQVILLSRSPFDLVFLALVPMQTIGFLAVTRFAGRGDLDVIAVVAPGLMAVWQNALVTCGEIVSKDRDHLRLELFGSSPVSLFLYLFGRVSAVTAFSLIVFTEAVLVGWGLFGVAVDPRGLPIVGITILTTACATVATSILLSVVFVNTRNPHSYQNALGYPFFILGGVLVPTSLYPHWLDAISDGVYLSWSADLLREAFSTGNAEFWALRNAVILAISGLTVVVGEFLLSRTMRNAKQEGRLAFT